MINKIKSYRADLKTFEVNPHIRKHKKDWFKTRLIEDVLLLIKGIIAIPFFILTLPFIIVSLLCNAIRASINLVFQGILIATGLTKLTNMIRLKKTSLVTTLIKEIDDEKKKPKKKRATSSKKSKTTKNTKQKSK